MANVNNNSVRINKSMVMRAAWEVLRKHEAVTFAEALHKAWNAYKLKAKMALGVVKFVFKKTNGEIRNAVGTLAKNLYQYDYKGTGHKSPAATIRYWDVEKHAFRSFCVGSLL